MVLFFADLIQNSLWIVNSTINLKKKLWGSWSGHHKVQANYKLNLVLYSHFSCTLLSLKSLWKALSWGMWSKWNLLLTVQIFTQIFLLHVQHCWQRHCGSHSENYVEERPQELYWFWLVLSLIAAAPLQQKERGNFGKEKRTRMLTLLLHLFWRHVDAVNKRK